MQWKIAHNLCRFSYYFFILFIVFPAIFANFFMPILCLLMFFMLFFSNSLVLFACLVVRPKMKIVYWFQRAMFSAYLCQLAWHFQLELLFIFMLVGARILNIVIYCNLPELEPVKIELECLVQDVHNQRKPVLGTF